MLLRSISWSVAILSSPVGDSLAGEAGFGLGRKPGLGRFGVENGAAGSLGYCCWVGRLTETFSENRDRQGTLTGLDLSELILMGEQEADMADADLIGFGVDDAGELGHVGVAQRTGL